MTVTTFQVNRSYIKLNRNEFDRHQPGLSLGALHKWRRCLLPWSPLQSPGLTLIGWLSMANLRSASGHVPHRVSNCPLINLPITENWWGFIHNFVSCNPVISIYHQCIYVYNFAWKSSSSQQITWHCLSARLFAMMMMTQYSEHLNILNHQQVNITAKRW